MILRFSAFLVLASSILITGCATSPLIWKASDISGRSESYIRLTHNNETVATVEASTIRKLVETKERIERAAGVGYAELLIASGDEPNAFSGNHQKFGRVVGINTGMLKLLGTDWDGFAAIIGHEYGHHALNHGAVRQEREALRQGIATAVGIALGVAGVPMGGTIADVGTTAVSTVYSREEEREADRKGFEYMVQAGFDPHGAIRVWEKMNAAGSSGLIPFLSTHPMSSERIENMKILVAGYQGTQLLIGGVQFRKPRGAEGEHEFQNLQKQANRKWQEEVAVVSPDVKEPPLKEQSTIVQMPSNNLEMAFASAREANDRKPANNSVAVAKGPTRWVWGTSWSAGTEDRARALALDYCKKQAIKEGISEPCKVYSVNGRVTEEFSR